MENKKFYCGNCGKVIDVRKDHLLGLGHGKTISCGCATKSSGEIKIEQLLIENNIDFQSQYRIKEFNIAAPFDFAIFDNGKIIKLIEYDGEQHFIPIEVWGGEEQLKIQQQRDEKKNQWCKEHNIPLLRIPYTDYDKISMEYLFPDFPNLKNI